MWSKDPRIGNPEKEDAQIYWLTFRDESRDFRESAAPIPHAALRRRRAADGFKIARHTRWRHTLAAKRVRSQWSCVSSGVPAISISPVILPCARRATPILRAAVADPSSRVGRARSSRVYHRGVFARAKNHRLRREDRTRQEEDRKYRHRRRCRIALSQHWADAELRAHVRFANCLASWSFSTWVSRSKSKEGEGRFCPRRNAHPFRRLCHNECVSSDRTASSQCVVFADWNGAFIDDMGSRGKSHRAANAGVRPRAKAKR